MDAPHVVKAPSHVVLSALVAREVMKWQVLVRPGNPNVIVGVLPPPPHETGLIPLPPFSTNFSAAGRVRDRIASLPSEVRRIFARELFHLIAQEHGTGAAVDPEAILHLQPRHICLAALTAVRSMN